MCYPPSTGILRTHSDVDQLTDGLMAKLLEHHAEVMGSNPVQE